MENGTALGGVEAADGALDFFPVELSQTGTLVRLKFARGDLFRHTGPFDGRHTFRWEVGSFEDSPTGVGDSSNWTDRLVGVPHSP